MTNEELFRDELDKMMTIIGADQEQTYFDLHKEVIAWGCRREADGIRFGRLEYLKGGKKC